VTEDSVEVIVERLENLKNDVKDGQLRAELWRERFDDKLADRPCEKHMGFFRAIDIQLKAIWTIVALVIAELVREHFTR
jgi:hypothetical protein